LQTPWIRQHFVVLASLTKLDQVYLHLGERAPQAITVCTNAWRLTATNNGGICHPSLAHQVLVAFQTAAQALSWVEHAALAIEQITQKAPPQAKPSFAMAIDCADAMTIDGALHSPALHRLVQLLWARTDGCVCTQQAHAALPQAISSRAVRVPCPRELGVAWQLGSSGANARQIGRESMLAGRTQAVDLGLTQPAQRAREPAVEAQPMLMVEWLSKKHHVQITDVPLAIGRFTLDGVDIPDVRVSRLHAEIRPRGNQFFLGDTSTNGTWVHFDGHPMSVELRQTECLLHGRGVISLGGDALDFSAPTIRFALTMSDQVNLEADSTMELGASTRGELLSAQ
jgi:hypothetical protein